MGSMDVSSFFFPSNISAVFSANAFSNDDFATLVMHTIRITVPLQTKL